MNRRALREFTHNAKHFLDTSNSNYKQWVFRYTFLELEKDLGVVGDITTNAIFKARQKITAEIVANEGGMIAGISEIKYFLIDADASFRSRLIDRFEIDFKVKDGAKVSSGEVIMVIKAELHDLLCVERVVLNLLGRMSGIATFTNRIVEMLGDSDVLITPTRKTLWGLLDKKAVTIGGGGTHRLNLADSVLVKDNHLDILEHDFALLAERLAFSKPECRFLEVEVDSKEDALKCASAFSGKNFESVPVIMFDNMKVSEIVEVLQKLRAEDLYDDFLFEASGGVKEENVLAYAKTGVDIISMGCLTDGVKRLDLSMRVAA